MVKDEWKCRSLVVSRPCACAVGLEMEALSIVGISMRAQKAPSSCGWIENLGRWDCYLGAWATMTRSHRAATLITMLIPDNGTKIRSTVVVSEHCTMC
jgi:hypothetical protein